jgi:cytoskeleton protein RodZ
MPPIGETLREARMRQRLDIADVEERTKIRAKYLRALENEEWGLLPGPTFVRTFLRTYAEVVGIDPHLLVEEYRVNHEPRDESEFQALGPLPQRDGRRAGRGRPAPRPPRRGGLVAASAVVALLAFLLALGLLGGDDGDDGGDGDDQAATTAETTPRKRADPKPERPRPTPRGVNVRIAPIEPTYACVDTGEGTDVVFEGNLDSPRTFRDQRALRINLGKRSAVITLNGRAVRITDSAEPLRMELTRGDSSELPAGEGPCA